MAILVNTDEQLLRGMIENSSEGFFIHDIVGKIIDANKAVYEGLGYTKNEMLSMNVSDIEVSYDHEVLTNTIWPSLEHKESTQVQAVHRCKNGTEIPVQLNITCFKKTDQTLFLALVRDISESEKMKAYLSKLAMTDELTQISNRRAFLAGLESEISFVERNEEQLSLLMLDLDYFKFINDQYGYSVGDEVLIQFANTANAVLRTEDLFGRLGGEKFAVLLRNTDLELANVLAERLRKSIYQMVTTVGGASIKITVSIGVASFSPPSDLDTLIKRADKALYKAKERGRNCVVLNYGRTTI